jgi:phage terminase small subunit
VAVLTNAKHEKFAQALAKGKTQVDAYAAAKYAATGKVAEANASRLLRNAKVAARVAELLERAANRAECTVADIARQLDEDREFARNLQNPSAAISATMGKAKVLGLVVDKAELTGKDGGPLAVSRIELVPVKPDGGDAA